MPNVAHFIFDCVKQVLEYGEIFTAQTYFAMLDQIDNAEYTSVVASLVVNMVKELQGVTVDDVVEWFFDKRGSVPSEIMKLVEEEKSESPIASVPNVKTIGNTPVVTDDVAGVTFVT